MKSHFLHCFLIIQILITNSFIYAQNYCFSKIDGIDLKGGYLGFASWCDYNSDGKLDIFVTGEDFGGDFQHAMLYNNNGDNTFSESNVSNIPRVIYGSSSWCDYDNDGNIDLLYSGTTSGMSEDNITKVYQNDGKGNFTDINAPVVQVGEGHVEWVDINNDGKTDIFLMGISNHDQFEVGVYKNNGNNSFEKKDNPFTPIYGRRGNFSKCEAKWADFDNDGLKDVVIAMSSASDFSFRFYKNLGSFNFQEINIGLPRLNYVSMAPGDINQDGLIDLIYTGSLSQTLYSSEQNNIQILINKGNMNFENAPSITSVGVFWNNIELADYTNDGYPDILYYGSRDNSVVYIFKNNKNNTFSFAHHYILDSEEGGSLFGDVDNNNVLDILHYGRMKYPNDYEATYVYKNTIGTSNLKPGPPTEIKLNAFENDLSFKWNTGTDDSTKSDGLYYNIRIGTKTNPDSIISGNSTDTKLKFIQLGNMNKNKTFQYSDFPEGHYTINIQSIDNSYNVSKFSEGVDFCFKHPKGMFSDTLSICQGDSIKLEADLGFINYKWNTAEDTREIYVKNEGIYNVNLLDNENCLSSEVVFVRVNALPIINLPAQLYISDNDSAILDAGSQRKSYLWSTGDTTQTTIFYGKKDEMGDHAIWVKVSDKNSCTSIDTTIINVSLKNGIMEVNDITFNIYPNPATDIISLNYSVLKDKKDVTIQIINNKGKVVFEKSYKTVPVEDHINVESLNAGSYYIRLKTGFGSGTAKLIKLD